MIYLFNSAFMPTYLENLYQILGLPEKSFVKLRYSENLNAPNKSFDKDSITKECTICYIDRFNDYLYIPIRRGIVRKVERADGRVYFHVELREHCYCQNNLEFTNLLKTEFNSAPKFNKTPENTDDGIYAQESELGKNLINNCDNAWSLNVDRIYDT